MIIKSRKLLVSLLFAGIAKALAALSAFALTAMITRLFSSEESGLFLLGFTLLTVLAVIFRFGLDGVILRYLSANHGDAFSQRKLNTGLLWIVTSSVPFTLLGMALSQYTAEHIFQKPGFGEVLFWMLPSLPAISLFFLLAMAFQSKGQVFLSVVFQNLGISALFVFGMMAWWGGFSENVSLTGAVQLYSVSSYIVLFLGGWLWFRQEGNHFYIGRYLDRDLYAASSNMWIASCMGLAVQWAGVLIAGALVPAGEVAQLSAATRTAMLTSFVLLVVGLVVAPIIARLWKQGNIEKLKFIAIWATRLVLLIALPVVIGLMVYSREVMGIFGAGYREASDLLSILVVGQLVNVSTGVVTTILNMTGHEKDINRIALLVGPLTVLLSLALTFNYGVKGAAISIAIGVAMQNIGAMVMVRRRLGFIPLG